MTIYKNINELKTDLKDILTFHDPHLTVHQQEHIHKAIDKLIYTAVFSQDETLQAKTRKIIHRLAIELGIHSSSMRNFYKAYAEGKVSGFTVPAMNLRMLTYDLARVIFRTAKRKNAAALIIEIAPTESQYTDQPPEEFATTILAAAIKENYIYPVFIQGDHCQFSPKRWTQDKHQEMKRLKEWVSRLLDAGFRNIDIDGSTLVDLSKPSLHAQQKENTFVTAEMTKFIREREKEILSRRTHPSLGLQTSPIPTKVGIPPSPNRKGLQGVPLSKKREILIGGEIGHIGDKNSTVEDFEAFMQLYLNRIHRGSGISKVSVQTGTSHGGVVNADGTVRKMAVDFSIIRSIGEIARSKYGIAGVVQHGASTLPLESFNKFVEAGTVEIHLSTGFQNIVYDSMPKQLRKEMYEWLKKECKDELKKGWTEEQFIYKTRKKAWGPFKKQVWGLSDKEKGPIIKALEEYVDTLFTQFNIEGTAEEVEKYTR